MSIKLARYFPILDWARTYKGETFANDMVAAVIVTIMLIPQSLAYALLAGLPPQIGLYASILPLIAYALLGTSRTLAVGPVAVVSLLTAAAAGKIAAQGSPEYIAAALLLAFISGFMLLGLGLLRLGFLANFLSHPVISGFIMASGIIIAASQLKHILGIDARGNNLLEIVQSLISQIDQSNIPTIIIGGVSLAFLLWVRKGFKPLLMAFGVSERPAGMIAKAGPIVAVAIGIGLVAAMGLDARGVKIVGDIPTGLPTLAMPSLDSDLWMALLGSAALISVIGFVESVSVAQTFAAKRRQRIDPNQELIALGTSNLAAGVSGGFPVTGGFSRSAVNFDAGAETPAAGAFTAIGIGLAALFLTPVLFYLPKAILAATIIVAVLTLINLHDVKAIWKYSKSDFAAMAATTLVTLVAGVEYGITTGVALSLFLHLYNTSRPHFALVGQIPGTHHFRNVDRHAVITSKTVLTIRVDESLYFANARFLEDTVYDLLSTRPEMKHLILMCSAVNRIDASGLESLEAINLRLKDVNVALHLTHVKGPVLDRLKRTDFLENLTGNLYLHQLEAMQDLDPDCVRLALGGTHEAS
ncbi:MAG: sulfate permease [Henriciella sp.]|nr:sulfate permease [Henriciella sp.]